MTLTTPLPDAEARRIAATDFGTNLVLLAGAGTGKTSLVIERMLNAVGSGRVQVTDLAAITFTEKAAGEMRERLALGLERLRVLARGEIEASGSSEADRAFGHLCGELGLEPSDVAGSALHALEQLDRAVVVTVHSFCSQILRSHPLEAGVDPGFLVDSGENAESARREAWERFVSRELGPRAERAELWERLLAQLPLETVGRVVRLMADFGVDPSLLEVSDPAAADALFRGEAAALVERIESMLALQRGMTPLALAYFDSMSQLYGELRDDGLKAFRTALAADPSLVNRIKRGQQPKPNKKLEGVLPEEMSLLSRRTGRLGVDLLAADDELAALLLQVVAPFVREFREGFLRQGFMSFDGLLALTRDLLRDHPGVRGEVKRRFRMLLVDEFQDTDPVQYEIVLLLAERPDEASADPYETNLEPGRLFVVGDAKQSIYRFRGADYTAYRRAVGRIVDAGGREMHLVGNFRSVAGVLDPINRLLTAGDGCWEASDYQPSYVPIEAVREQEDSAPRVELWTVNAGPEPRAEDRRRAEGALIAEEIHRLVEQDGACSYREITILFRAFTAISFYLRPLRELGIPFVVDGGREFLERPEVAQLMATLRTLAQPADPAALLAFLRSPAGGVPDTELAAHAAGGGHWDWRHEEVPAGCPRIAKRFALLRGLDQETRHLRADAVVHRVIDRTLMLPLGAAAFEGAQRVSNLRKLAAAAGDLARDGRLSLDEVVEGLREGLLIDIKTDAPLADDAADAVRITSIHRMKGLENSRVFVPDLARGKHRGLHANEVVDVVSLPDESSGLALRVGKLPNSLRVWFELQAEQHEAAEEVRVLYVALTRARDRLVLVSGASRNPAAWIDALSPWGYDRELPPADGALLAESRVQHRIMKPESVGRRIRTPTPVGAEQAVERYVAATESLRRAASAPFSSPSGISERRPGIQPVTVAAAVSDRRDVGKAVGNLLHRWLEGWGGVEGTDSSRFRRLCAALAREASVNPASLTRQAELILDVFLSSELAQLFRRAEILGRETPLLLRRDGGPVYRGKIDLIYRTDGGEVVVADYKTDRETSETKLRQHYGKQLNIYADAVHGALDLPRAPRAELWVLRSGKRVAIERSLFG